MMPSDCAVSTALAASALPCLRARVYFPLRPGLGLMVSSSPYRGKRGWQEACGPSVIGSSLQPLASCFRIHVGVRLGWLRQARESPEM